MDNDARNSSLPTSGWLNRWGVWGKILVICLLVAGIIFTEKLLYICFLLSLLLFSLNLIPNAKWRRKILMGGAFGAIGMLLTNGFPYTLSGFNYHVSAIQYLRPFFLGVFVGIPAGLVDKDTKKQYVVPLISGLFSLSGAYLWRQIYESGVFGEGIVILGFFLPLLLVVGAISAGVGLGQVLLSQEKRNLASSFGGITLRVVACTCLCFLVSLFFFSHNPFERLVFGFVLGGGTYLIGENN